MFDNQRRLKWCVLLGVVLLAACAPSASEEPAEESPQAGVAAKVGDRTITIEQLDERARTTNMTTYQALYDARRRVLDQLIDDQLLENEAAAQGVTVEQLVRGELEKRVQPVTDANIEAFYNQQKTRMEGKTLEQVREQIRAFLTRAQAQTAQQQFYKELREKVAVQVSLDPPRAEIVVTANERVKGPDTAKVTIVEYSDFQ